MTADVCENFSFEAKFADSFAIGAWLFRCGRRCQFDVIDAKLIESSGNSDFSFSVEESIGKLFSLSLLDEHCLIIWWKGSTKVDSMMEKFDTRDKKSSALARTRQFEWEGDLSYGLLLGVILGWLVTCWYPFVPFESLVTTEGGMICKTIDWSGSSEMWCLECLSWRREMDWRSVFYRLMKRRLFCKKRWVNCLCVYFWEKKWELFVCVLKGCQKFDEKVDKI